MGWQDRNYNPGHEDMSAYFSNPGAVLQYAFPLFTSSTLQIRLTFWFLLGAIYIAVDDLTSPILIPLDIVLMLVVCLWHELGHRVFARMVGGNHWEWVLWPLGGMVAPSAPRAPWPTFVANIGGILFSAAAVAAAVGGALAYHGEVVILKLLVIPIGVAASLPNGPPIADHLLQMLFIQSYGIIFMNLFPCFWFDGGYIWQSILWPKLGQWKATRVVCLAGMILAVPLALLSLTAGWSGFLMTVFWALIFADCFNRRRALAAAGPGVMEEDEVTYNYMDTPEPKRKKHKKRWLRSARRKAVRDQAEQAKIDAILDKVKIQGLHSLSWWEKRTLKRATERQRQRDLANRP